MLVVTDTPVPQPPTPTELLPTVQAVVDTPTIEPTQIPVPSQAATANDVANLRGGPGTDFAIVGNVAAGQPLTIVGRNAAGNWYQLSDGNWIAAFLVTGASGDLAVVGIPEIETSAVPAAPVVEQPTTAPSESDGSAFTCAGGCATPPDPSCTIKGNVNSQGEKIFHTTDSSFYGRTVIKPEERDAWFCTTQEAEAARFRAPRNN